MQNIHTDTQNIIRCVPVILATFLHINEKQNEQKTTYTWNAKHTHWHAEQYTLYSSHISNLFSQSAK